MVNIPNNTTVNNTLLPGTTNNTLLPGTANNTLLPGTTNNTLLPGTTNNTPSLRSFENGMVQFLPPESTGAFPPGQWPPQPLPPHGGGQWPPQPTVDYGLPPPSSSTVDHGLPVRPSSSTVDARPQGPAQTQQAQQQREQHTAEVRTPHKFGGGDFSDISGLSEVLTTKLVEQVDVTLLKNLLDSRTGALGQLGAGGPTTRESKDGVAAGTTPASAALGLSTDMIRSVILESLQSMGGAGYQKRSVGRNEDKLSHSSVNLGEVPNSSLSALFPPPLRSATNRPHRYAGANKPSGEKQTYDKDYHNP